MGGWLWYYWAFALAFIPLGLFALPEFLAIKLGGPTFSRFMYTINQTKFGVIWGFLWGFLIGFLLAHFSGWCEGPGLG